MCSLSGLWPPGCSVGPEGSEQGWVSLDSHTTRAAPEAQLSLLAHAKEALAREKLKCWLLFAGTLKLHSLWLLDVKLKNRMKPNRDMAGESWRCFQHHLRSKGGSHLSRHPLAAAPPPPQLCSLLRGQILQSEMEGNTMLWEQPAPAPSFRPTPAAGGVG